MAMALPRMPQKPFPSEMDKALRKTDSRRHVSFRTKAVWINTLARDRLCLLKGQESLEVVDMDSGAKCLGSMSAAVT